MQGKRHDRVVEMRLCFFSGKVGDYKVPFKSTRKCRSTVKVAVAVFAFVIWNMDTRYSFSSLNV